MKVLIEARNAKVAFQAGHIVNTLGHSDIILSIPDGEVRPGLINAHDHLHRNHYGRLGSPPYWNAYEWGDDIHRTRTDVIARGRLVPRRDALLRGAWKNLFSGVTTVVHHDRWEDDFDDGFPVRVVPVRWAHSLRSAPEVSALRSGRGGFMIHLAEGVDPAATEEVREMERLGLLNRDLLAVHVVGADDDGVSRLRASGAAVVWCPTSNHFLLGRTAPAALLAPGVDVLLGSDSLLTGDGTLLDELRFARGLGLVSEGRLRGSVGSAAARRLGSSEPSLAPGSIADLIVVRRDILDATVDDVVMVVVGGVIRVLDPALTPRLGALEAAGRAMELDGTLRWTDQRVMVPLINRQALSR